jgi:hypothetical protein
LWYRGLNRQNLPEKQLLVPPGTKFLISTEDDVDDLQGVLKLRVAPVILVILGFFVRRLLVLLATTGVVERPPKVVVVNGGMIGTWVPRALLLQELLKLILHRRLLAL